MSSTLNPPFIRFLRGFVPFGFMASINYSFANPDQDNVYDVFPVQRSKYAFVSGYSVKHEDRMQFEKRWKDLARFYQGQEGYLFNKLIRQEEPDDQEKVLYLDFNQWTTGDAYKIAASRATRVVLWDKLQEVCEAEETYKQPMMYKTVVDDTEFTPSEVLNARKTSNVAVSMNSRNVA